MARTPRRPRTSARGLLGAATALGLAAGTLLLGAAPALAATGSIDFVEPNDDQLQVLFSVDDVPDGVSPDLATVTVTFDGEPVEATAQAATGAEDTVRRTTILAMDVSESMEGAKFEAAKSAAQIFLDTVPDDVYVGLVTFAGAVEEVVAPTQDRAAVGTAVDGLELSFGTLLYDGIIQATESAGEEGSRSLLVLSDGRDTSDTQLAQATKAIEDSEVRVDVVALAQNPTDQRLLQPLVTAGNGAVLPADDPDALSDVFAGQAEELAQQMLITVSPTEELLGKEGTMAVTVQVDGQPTVDEAFVSMPTVESAAGGGEQVTLQPAESGFQVPTGLMYGGLAAAALSVVAILFLAFGGSRDEKQDAVDSAIEAYTRKGAKKLAAANRESDSSQSMTAQAVGIAESVLEGQKGLEAALGSRLEAAGMAIKPAEWLLIHIGIAVGLGLAGILFGGGNLFFMLGGVLLGLAGPWFYLSFMKNRRLKAFKYQLADTLQLMAGSLSAGLSLAQSLDTVVREGTDPVASEFRRALVEARLGVEIEDALTGVADRMQSVDFEWVVMAIRIQRDVGGNLSELLNKVAETIREREYLERQVKTLSAEGRLSVWILGGLPPAFMGYLVLANPDYVMPMFTNPLGWAMLITMAVLLTGGIFWMRKVVKVEV